MKQVLKNYKLFYCTSAQCRCSWSASLIMLKDAITVTCASVTPFFFPFWATGGPHLYKLRAHFDLKLIVLHPRKIINE